MLNWLKAKWEGFKEFFNYSETKFLGWVTATGGFVTTLMSSINWDPLLSLNFTDAFNWTQASWIGLVTLLHGLSTVALRNRGEDWSK